MNRRFGLLAVIACSWFVGCNTTSNPATSPVTGTVTLDGKVVEGADVIFTPTDTAQRPAMGITDAQGKYSLGTFKADDGAMPGQYTITVTKFWSEADDESPYGNPQEEAPAAKPMTLDDEQAAYEKAYKGPQVGARPPKSGNGLPKKYESVDTSGLTHTVTDRPTVFDIELKKTSN